MGAVSDMVNHLGRTRATSRVMARGEQLGAPLTRRRIRVLAYHGVDDAERFERQMAHLRAHYVPVSAGQVVGAFRDGEPLPDRAVWVTFDDGLPSVVERGLPTLERARIPATLFVCPGLIDSGTPNWWDIVDTAVAHGFADGLVGRAAPASATTHLKTWPDPQRRAVVAQLAAALDEAGIAPAGRQLDDDELDRWHGAGMDVGNHSWDHPCLDRCEPEEQRRQVTEADAWLRARAAPTPRVFAYPNGNATSVVEDTLAELGYDLALLFDHRLASTTESRFRVSRLRVSSAADDARFAAILSGAHGAGYHLQRRLRSTKSADDRNKELYEQPTVVGEYAPRDELMACEEVLVDTYVSDGAAVLDVGVGTGRTTSALHARAGRYLGIDYSAPMIEAARTRHPDAQLEVMDAADLRGLADAMFDVVMFSFNGLDCLHPERKRSAAIEELARVTRPGGTLILSSHNARALIRPPIARDGAPTVRDRLARAVMSARLATHALTSRAFWTGAGYLRDTTSPQTLYASTPDHIRAEFARSGLVLRERVGSRHPLTLAPGVEPWYYYAFRRELS